MIKFAIVFLGVAFLWSADGHARGGMIKREHIDLGKFHDSHPEAKPLGCPNMYKQC